MGSEFTIKQFQFPVFENRNVHELYFRSNNDYKIDNEKECIYLKKRQSLKTNTYFNCLNIRDWHESTYVSNISLKIEIRGTFKYRLITADEKQDKECKSNIIEGEIVAQQKSYIVLAKNLKIDDLKQICYLEIISKEQDAEFYGGYFYSNDKVKNDKIKILAIICTFKREKYVRRNIDYFKVFLNKNPLAKKWLYLVVVDNASSLEPFNSKNIKVIINKNTGGAGGFSRGMLEAIESKNKYTHIVLMDDDIAFNPMIFHDTWAMLSFAKKRITLGAAMLNYDDQLVFQHEKGSFIKGDFFITFHSVERGLDTRKLSTSFKKINPDYNAWWWYCFPVEAVIKNGYSYPFFIKFDDVEFGIRLKKKGYKLLIPQGFAIWHEPFDRKYSAKISYYRFRNGWIFNALQNKEIGTIKFIKMSLIRALIELKFSRYEHLKIFNLAIKDFLKGDKILMRDPANTLKQLNSICKKEKFAEYKIKKDDIIVSKKIVTKKKKIFNKITLNGLIYTGIGEIIYDISKNPGFEMISHKRKIINYNPQAGIAFTVKKSLLKNLIFLSEIPFICLLIALKYKHAVKTYQKSYEYFISKKFWKKYLGIVG